MVVATGLLLTDMAAPPIRATQDVDVITEVATMTEYYLLAEKLRAGGFQEDSSENAPICRWKAGGLLLDVMPTNPELLGQDVTIEEKEGRAEEIADILSNNNEWKSHGRPINIETLEEKLRLKIEDYSNNEPLRSLIRQYYDLLSDYVKSNKLPIFVQTKLFI